MNAELTRPHFSTKVYKCYLHYLRQNYPEIDLEAICRDAGLTLRHIENENNWVSVVFDSAFTLAVIKETRNPRFPFEAGRQNATPAVLGTLVHLMVRFSLSLDLVYRTLPRFTSFFTQVTELHLKSMENGIAIYQFGPKDLNKLTADEIDALKANYENVLQNTLGHYSGLPTVKSKLPALVKFKEIPTTEPLTSYEIEINYGVSEHPLRKLTEKSIPNTSAAVSLVTTSAALLLGVPLDDSSILGVLTGLIFLAIRGHHAQRGMGQLLETLARDYEILDRKYHGIQRTKERFSRLASRNRHYRHLFDELEVAIAVIRGPDFHTPKISLANGAMERFPSELKRELLENRTPMLQKCGFQKSPQVLDPLQIVRDGKQVFYSVRMFPVSGSDVALFVDDNTEAVRAAEAIEKEKAKSAEAAKLAALGTMAAGISHELCNPLSVATLLCDQIVHQIQRNQQTDIPQTIGKVQNHLERMGKIIHSVKRFSRRDTTTQTQPILFSTILAGVLELAEKKLEETASELTIETLPPDLQVQANEIELTQVLVNLVENACDAMSKQNLRNVKIVTTEKDQWTQIDVIDTGPGIPEALREQVLNPFFTTKEIGKGTGLGLSLSATIIDHHRGTLEILSTQPTTIRIRLPKENVTERLETTSQNK